MRALTTLIVLVLLQVGDQTPDVTEQSPFSAISILVILLAIGVVCGAAGLYMLRRRRDR